MSIYPPITGANMRTPTRSTDPTALQLEADALEASLRDMSASFSRDYVAGRMGVRHNTYQHRARVLRQLTAQLAAMRTEALLSAS
ncbi:MULTISPECIES: hypothetical protein [Sphingomonas]|uniref:Uncharacterized protein n=1 Tax=Sphingomonas kyeonggiensis TaxID=1268553 RepID=A0A7W6NYK2_9SPHN|nr:MULTISPECIES: hypothetical protein [Sphingomonas]MBB4101299.1 hypothetical protein [Sphingomonas kyeonggiensis]MDQ0249486.1 hypothetical protein [Sphingomonas kyeonggiensis]WHU02350.1 hypothetical protein O3305_19540 [Sphingomonas sp. NIBR02145]